MTTKLKVFNRALRYCGERKIADLTEDREPRHLLDDVWDDGAVDVCLAEAQWKFAIRAMRLDYDPAITTDFGYRYAFSKPDDWVATSAVCSDEYFNTPLIQYSHENDYWFCDLEEIYVKYVSNDSAYGNDLSLWPATFANYVSAYMADEIVDKLTAAEGIILRVEQRHEENRLKAKNKDAQNQAQKFAASGSWTTSRGQFAGRTRDRGNRGSLLG